MSSNFKTLVERQSTHAIYISIIELSNTGFMILPESIESIKNRFVVAINTLTFTKIKFTHVKFYVYSNIELQMMC